MAAAAETHPRVPLVATFPISFKVDLQCICPSTTNAMPRHTVEIKTLNYGLNDFLSGSHNASRGISYPGGSRDSR